MEFEGILFKNGRDWLVEVPSLDLMTQGKTQKEALEMIADATMGLVECYFDIEEGFSVTATEHKKGIIGITATNHRILLALSLRRQREKSGSTVREAAARLGSSSPNAYAQYERGRLRISLEKYDELLRAANPVVHSLMRVI